jgi:hypothetical protein
MTVCETSHDNGCARSPIPWRCKPSSPRRRIGCTALGRQPARRTDWPDANGDGTAILHVRHSLPGRPRSGRRRATTRDKSRKVSDEPACRSRCRNFLRHASPRHIEVVGQARYAFLCRASFEFRAIAGGIEPELRSVRACRARRRSCRAAGRTPPRCPRCATWWRTGLRASPPCRSRSWGPRFPG